MLEIHNGIYIGSDIDCFWGSSDEWAVIHACKINCHRKAVGYKGNLNQRHPNYLIREDENHLALNIVDMEQPLLPKFANPIMQRAMNFIDKHLEHRDILIHCNQGYSRSPSIGLIYLAREGVINNNSYRSATVEFRELYPDYNPANGIAVYCERNWNSLMEM